MSIVQTKDVKIVPIKAKDVRYPIAIFQDFQTGTGDGSGGTINLRFVLPRQGMLFALAHVQVMCNTAITTSNLLVTEGNGDLHMLTHGATSGTSWNASTWAVGSYQAPRTFMLYRTGTSAEVATIINPNTNTQIYHSRVLGFLWNDDVLSKSNELLLPMG